MTRKDYILIANALRDARDLDAPIYSDAEIAAVDFAATKIAEALATDNPRFDREHFLAVVRSERALTSRPSRKPVHNHVPHNPKTMQTVCEKCGIEMTYNLSRDAWEEKN